MLLYPDMSRESYSGNDNFVFAAPCQEWEWESMWRSCDKDEDYLPYVIINEFFHENAPPDWVACVILMRDSDSDDDALTTAAWLRVTQEYTGMIYAIKCDPAYQGETSLSSIVARTSGVDPKQVRHIELPTKRKEGK